MATKPREWPSNVKEVRNLTSENSVRQIQLLQPILEGQQFTEVEIIRRIAIVINLAQKNARMLESVGAQTKPF